MPKAKISQLGEFGWLKRLLPRLYWPPKLNPQLCIGPGDDAGALRIKAGNVLVATTDALVEGIHFERRWLAPEDIGFKVLAVNLSDLAAMGNAKPLAALVTAAIPGDTPVEYVNNLYKGMKSCAQRWKTGFLGGDTVGSKRGLFISVTLLGEANPRELIKRSGAKPGDDILATGPLGLAAAGLEAHQSGQGKLTWTKSLVTSFSRPIPRLDLGQILGRNHLATSMMDCSDGLNASVRLLAEASNVGAELYLDQLPHPPELVRWAVKRRKSPFSYMLDGGEDYELIFTAAPKHWPAISRKIPGATRIGRILPKGKGNWAGVSGRRFPLKGYGFSHFDI